MRRKLKKIDSCITESTAWIPQPPSETADNLPISLRFSSPESEVRLMITSTKPVCLRYSSGFWSASDALLASCCYASPSSSSAAGGRPTRAGIKAPTGCKSECSLFHRQATGKRGTSGLNLHRRISIRHQTVRLPGDPTIPVFRDIPPMDQKCKNFFTQTFILFKI